MENEFLLTLQPDRSCSGLPATHHCRRALGNERESWEENGLGPGVMYQRLWGHQPTSAHREVAAVPAGAQSPPPGLFPSTCGHSAGKDGCNRTEQQGLAVKAQRESHWVGWTREALCSSPGLSLVLRTTVHVVTSLPPLCPPWRSWVQSPSEGICMVSFQLGARGEQSSGGSTPSWSHLFCQS